MLAAHGAVLALVLLGAPAMPERAGEAGTLKTFALADAPAPAPSVPPAPVRPPIVPTATPVETLAETAIVPIVALAAPLPVFAPPPPLLAVSAGSGAVGTACDLAGAVQRAIEQDAPARAALAAVPRRDRSVANAIMLWNAEWSADARLDAVRTAVLATVAAAAPPCREEVQAGPRLVALADERGATMLVIGSGRWRWVDLAPPPPITAFVAVRFDEGTLLAARSRMARPRPADGRI